MSQKAKRILNAAVLGFLTALLLQAVNAWADLTNAVQQGDWISVKKLCVAAVFAAVAAAFRALQSYVPQVPSPEQDEQTPPKGG